ncbi:hemicentin-2 [Nilaparvata lugens]|uniref:hemicentin-2 n=1 Tax=Nilaparvata lugens TaxID=108931 RepID=UPI00193D2513|nr:hemicentin-2 [Nilaparvata lugens]
MDRRRLAHFICWHAFLLSLVKQSYASGSGGIEEVRVAARGEARLECSVAGVAGPGGVTWRHNGKMAEAGLWDPATGRLLLSSARAAHAGLWQCEDPPSGLQSEPIRLVVLEAPSALYLVVEERRLDPGNEFIPVKEKMRLVVECVAEGGTPPEEARLLWEPAGGEPVTMAGGVAKSRYTIDSLQRHHHNSTLVCILHHPALQAPANASLRLDVQYAPSFEISRLPGFGIPLVESISVSLKCDVDANPSAKPVWQKDDGPAPVTQTEDGFLNFTAIRREDSGWYKCTARHPLGDFSSIRYFLNVQEEASEMDKQVTEQQEAAVEVEVGGNVQLQCPAGAAGCWGRLGSGGRMEPLGAGPTLSLDRVLYQEAGQYRCLDSRANSLDQWRTHTVHVTVIGGPQVFPLNGTVQTVTGRKAVLSVEFCANPPVTRALWLTQSRVIRPGQAHDRLFAHNLTEGSSEWCHKAGLTVSPVHASDQGEYSFLVRTPKGLAEATLLLNVSDEGGLQASTGSASKIPSLLLLTVIFLQLIKISSWL